MDDFLISKRKKAARTDIRRQGTTFDGTSKSPNQKIGSKALRSTTFMYPMGGRATGKPDKYRA